jgi:hypothetical protein
MDKILYIMDKILYIMDKFLYIMDKLITKTLKIYTYFQIFILI